MKANTRYTRLATYAIVAFLIGCFTPTEPKPIAVKQIEWQSQYASLPSKCHRAQDVTQCLIKLSAAALISISVPFACTSVPLCMGAVAGAGLAWNDYFRENARYLDGREARDVW